MHRKRKCLGTGQPCNIIRCSPVELIQLCSVRGWDHFYGRVRISQHFRVLGVRILEYGWV